MVGTPFIIALAYVALYQLSSRVTIKPIVSATIIALTPFFYNIVIRTIYGVNIISWTDILTTVLQFATAYVIFYKLHYDDSLLVWILWGAFGLISIVILVPAFVFFIYMLLL
jgi:hypothetical protein